MIVIVLPVTATHWFLGIVLQFVRVRCILETAGYKKRLRRMKGVQMLKMPEIGWKETKMAMSEAFFRG